MCSKFVTTPNFPQKITHGINPTRFSFFKNTCMVHNFIKSSNRNCLSGFKERTATLAAHVLEKEI
jgi:hypothetical protein